MQRPGTLSINLIVKRKPHFYIPHFEPIFQLEKDIIEINI